MCGSSRRRIQKILDFCLYTWGVGVSVNLLQARRCAGICLWEDLQPLEFRIYGLKSNLKAYSKDVHSFCQINSTFFEQSLKKRRINLTKRGKDPLKSTS